MRKRWKANDGDVEEKQGITVEDEVLLLDKLKKVYQGTKEGGEEIGKRKIPTEAVFKALVEAEKDALTRDGGSHSARNRTLLPKCPVEKCKELLELKEYWSEDSAGKLALVQKYVQFENDTDSSPNFLNEILNTTKLARYVEHLTGYWHQTPSTVRKNIEAVRKALVWYQTTKIDVSYNAATSDSDLEDHHKTFHRCQQAQYILLDLQRTWQKLDSKNVRRCNTIGAIILGNQWPTDDQVQNIISRNVDKYNEIRSAVLQIKKSSHCQTVSPHSSSSSSQDTSRISQDQRSTKIIDPTQWRWLLSFIANTLNIHVCFGRPSLFQGLTCSMGRTGLKGGITASSNFKTAHKWLIHGLVFEGGFVVNILQDWMDIWRPLRALKQESDQDPLFVSYEGKTVYDWSRYLAVLWQSTYGMSMTCTILRYWKATKMALSATTKEDRELVTHADCHGVAVTKKYYEKVFSLMDAYKAKSITDQACGLQSPSQPDQKEEKEPSLDLQPSIHPSGTRLQKRKKQKRGGRWSKHDDKILLEAHHQYGNQWARMFNNIRNSLEQKERRCGDLKDRIKTLEKQEKRQKLLDQSRSHDHEEEEEEVF